MNKIKEFYNTIKNKNDNFNQFKLKNDDRFLIEFLNFKDPIFNKTEMIQTGNLENIDNVLNDTNLTKITDDNILAIINYFGINDTKEEIYFADSIFSELNINENNDDIKFSSISIDSFSFIKDKDITNKTIITQEEVNDLIFSDEETDIVPKIGILDDEYNLLVSDSAYKLISSSEDFNIEFDAKSEISEEDNLKNIIPDQKQNDLYINKLILDNATTEISDDRISFIENTDDTVYLKNIMDGSFNSININFEFSKEELEDFLSKLPAVCIESGEKNLFRMCDSDERTNKLSWGVQSEDNYDGFFLFNSSNLVVNDYYIFESDEIDNFFSGTDKISGLKICFPNEMILDEEGLAVVEDFFANISFEKELKRNNILGYYYTNNLLFESSSNKNNITQKVKAGRNIDLSNSNDKYIINFHTENRDDIFIEMEEGILTYDSVLQLARNEISGDEIDKYNIVYEETTDSKCSFEINKNIKKITIYVNEIIESVANFEEE